jgi:8-oxo-dGTP pyrophosphatase MutT (NUDIX family)
MQTDLGAFSSPEFRHRAVRCAHPLAYASAAAAPATASCPSGSDIASNVAPIRVRGDHDLNPDICTAFLSAENLRPAAVLIPVADRGTHASVILTKRSPDMPAHAGQIAFPGGTMATGDASAIETALRETHEEIGIAQEFIKPLGLLDTYCTRTGFQIVPVLALVREGFTLTLDEREVADVFEVPLAHLMTEANFLLHEKEIHGKVRYFYAIPYESYYIWGATAGILRSMYERLYTE